MPQTEHHPPHFFLDNTWYMITAHVHQQAKLLRSPEHKDIVRDCLRRLVSDFGLTIAAWGILDNHHHVLAKVKKGAELARAIRQWHGRAAHDLNELEGVRGRQVWHNYWDTCIRTERDFWVRFNYIHHNPVKHGYVQQPGDWAHSSYGYYRRAKGEDWLLSAWERYPVVDFTDPNEP